MSIFNLPKTWCSKINLMIADFWWGQTNTGRKIHWPRWDAPARKKEVGGLGFRELETFNMALLIKMADRIFKDPDSLWARVLKGVYYPQSDFVSGRKGGRSSWGWASICSARDTLLQERMWRVRDGKSICVFNDLWVYMKEGFKLEGRNSQPTYMMMKVCELFNADRTWNEELVLSVATPSDDHCVLQIPLPA